MKQMITTALTAILAMLALTSCNKELLIVEPTYSKISQESVRIDVQFDANDAKHIKDKGIYLTLTSLECQSGANRYPAEAFVGRSRVSGFDFLVANEALTFYADVPIGVFSRYERPCLVLEGGSYLGRTVSSKSTPIEPKRGSL